MQEIWEWTERIFIGALLLWLFPGLPLFYGFNLHLRNRGKGTDATTSSTDR